MTDLQLAWDAAIGACLQGHPDCTYGGPTPSTGYWLAAEGCTENHGDHCVWCPAEAVTGFAGWGDDGWSIWGVPACQPCADRWVAEHPEWTRRDPDAEQEPRKTMTELLAEMNSIERGIAEAYNRAMDEAFFGVTGSDGKSHEFGGLLSALGMGEADGDGGENAGLRRRDLDVAMDALFPQETATERIARILTDAGWTDAALGAETGNRRWVTDDCPADCRYMAVEHWHGWFCDAPYVGGPDGIMEQPDFSEVAVKVAPPIRSKRGKR